KAIGGNLLAAARTDPVATFIHTPDRCIHLRQQISRIAPKCLVALADKHLSRVIGHVVTDTSIILWQLVIGCQRCYIVAKRRALPFQSHANTSESFFMSHPPTPFRRATFPHCR